MESLFRFKVFTLGYGLLAFIYYFAGLLVSWLPVEESYALDAYYLAVLLRVCTLFGLLLARRLGLL